MLATGVRIGPYEVTGTLGAGGMGQVYRATDSTLGRTVALKVLPDSLATDPERLARFDREARTLAALSHPNIAQIYGVEQSSAVRALVMELVEGEDLSSRIAGAPLPTAEALAIARQVASALEAAHELGIVHRDLKPANIRVREDGSVKVLDFGLAKAMDGPAMVSDAQPTSPAMTVEGVILGTAAYMAPEQARGRAVDKRADIWAFGVLLYEMFTRLRPFEGETVADTIGRIVSHEADLALLPADVPHRVRELVRRCLDKDPRTRLRDIGEARILLDSKPESIETIPEVRRRQRPALAAVLVALLVGAAAALGWWIGRGSASQPPGFESFTQLTSKAGEETSPSISPDGSAIAYASRIHGTWDIFVQRVGGHNPVLVAGDPARDESAPAFSPDGLTLAFHESDRDGGVFLVGATGESARRLTDFGFDPAWSHNGSQIVFASEATGDPFIRRSVSTVWIVSAGGGAPRKISDGDAVGPTWSPSSRRIAFWVAEGGQRDLFTMAADGSDRKPITNDAALDWSPAWSADGHIYFASDRAGSMNIWRVAIDEASGRLTAPPELVTKAVHVSLDRPSLSRDGTRLVFRAHTRTINPAAIRFDPVRGAAAAPELLLNLNDVLVPTSVSPDGEWLLLHSQMATRDDIFLCRRDGSGLRRLTDDVHRDRWPRWSRDGRQVFFFSNRGGRYAIWSIQSDGGGLRKVSEYSKDLLYPVIARGTDRLIASHGTAPGSFIADLSKPWTADTAHLMEGLEAEDEWLIPVDSSPDGRRLVGPMRSRSGTIGALGVFEFNGSVSGTLIRRSPVGDNFGVAWLDDRRVAVIHDSARILLLDVETGTSQTLVGIGSWRFSPIPPAISPDRRTIYVGVVDEQSDVWMVTR
jgi:eukaryotic-like serine/threonine-protein kinase